MFDKTDVECMSHALRLARRGQYSTRPNPNVGCVIVDDAKNVIGEGFHQKAGAAHAEINALNQAGAAAQGATAYVTLEPCCHQGKTGPCTDVLIQAGIKKVFVAHLDPNPLVAGKGVKHLQQHGIEVIKSLLQEQAYQLNRGFIKRMQSGLPWVVAKIASSCDGRTALSNGASKWISSENSRHDVQWLRARHDAILTGINTVLADDPQLNVRLSANQLGVDQVLQPVRIILDPELSIPTEAKLLSLPGKTIIFTAANKSARDRSSEELNTRDNCDVIEMKTDQNKFSLSEVLKHIAKLEINSVLIEAGPSLLGKLIDAKLVDEVVHYIAPLIMGNQAKGMFDVGNFSDMSQAIKLKHQDIRQVGNDIRITSLIKY